MAEDDLWDTLTRHPGPVPVVLTYEADPLTPDEVTPYMVTPGAALADDLTVDGPRDPHHHMARGGSMTTITVDLSAAPRCSRNP